ncbi:DUF4190 domain-containing protein [Pyxidicoccus sp. MSG2]|uniref:DUF4190 domain-containing protein n=1 Tax=Pyxidicoccus sp. MSG2 TaxID=2996790 RepID=UPI00226D4273|nr:DUF4190 domain-containing protein [Pyxidicoccus sp. MSG2]MCY1016726.1 DUF4190 domain-containing protein [Pyxidicoccus sp. MSG2]
MNAQPLSNTPDVEGSRCHAHPDRPALGTCARCGTFYCEQDRQVVHGKTYCEACSVRPEVDYLEGFRLKYWGKRDSWAWLVGFGSVLNVISGLASFASGVTEEAIVFGVFGLVAGVVGACFWLGIPWARTAIIGVPIASMALGMAGGAPSALARGIIPLLVTIAIYNDTRNKLFFKLEVPAGALKTAWDLYMNNTMARAGVMLGVLSFIPGVGVLALICSIIGLRRVNPDATPPIGRKGQAIAGIILGALGTLAWGGFMLSMMLNH